MDTDPVWLLTGDRPGEIAQQRALAEALGLPYREIRVAALAPAGGVARFDLRALEAPWPRVAISFGKTLDAALELRRRAEGRVRIVQLGRPRGVAWRSLDLIVPMPQDVVPDDANIQRVRMPFNHSDGKVADSVLQRLSASTLPRPWTLLALGGISRQYRFDADAALQLVHAVIARVRASGGSLLLTTSPRTPPEVAAALSQPLGVPGEFYVFRRDDADNPFTAYTQLADEIVISGDSPSMVAECWRSGKPVLVQPLHRTPRYWCKQQVRRWIPDPVIRSGRIAAALDINAWLQRLADAGYIGLLGRSEPRLAYSAAADDDLAQVCRRIRALLPQDT